MKIEQNYGRLPSEAGLRCRTRRRPRAGGGRCLKSCALVQFNDNSGAAIVVQAGGGAGHNTRAASSSSRATPLTTQDPHGRTGKTAPLD